MERAIAETSRRRDKQHAYNIEHGITPQSIKRDIMHILDSAYEKDSLTIDPRKMGGGVGLNKKRGMAEDGTPFIGHNLRAYIADLEKQMRELAGNLEFEAAAKMRDEIKRLEAQELAIADDPLAASLFGVDGRRVFAVTFALAAALAAAAADRKAAAAADCCKPDKKLF